MWALNHDDSSKTPNSPPDQPLIPSSEVACNRAVGNLILMAVCNIVLNVALIILPFPMLRHLRLDLKEKLQLGFLFSVGAVLVAITILRLPLILNESVSQRSRSMVNTANCMLWNMLYWLVVVGFNWDSMRMHRRQHTLLLRSSERSTTTTRRSTRTISLKRYEPERLLRSTESAIFSGRTNTNADTAFNITGYVEGDG